MAGLTIAWEAMSFAALVSLCACSSSGGGAAPTDDATADSDVDALVETSADSSADSSADTFTEAAADGGATGNYVGRVVGLDGLAGYDALSAADRTALKATKVAFFHASVGGNVLEGASNLGFSFQPVVKGSDYATVTLGEYDYGGLNGNATGKVDEYLKIVDTAGVGSAAHLIGAKFCWADIDGGTNLATLESKYASAIASMRGGSPSARFFHVTPPLKTSADAGDNPPRLQLGQWMATTYGADAVVLDLATIESTDAAGAACTAGGARALCAAWASDDGHLNAAGEARAGKAFLFALHVARTAAAR